VSDAATSEILLDDYDSVQQAFRRRAMKQALYDEGGVIMQDALLTLHGTEHRERRRLENRLFRRDVFRYYDQDLLPQTIEETVKPFVAAGRADLLPIGHRTTLNFTALVSGVDRPLGTPEETEQLYGFVLQFSDGATLVHSTRDHAEVRDEVAAALEEFDRLFLQPSIERRKGLLADFAAGRIDEDDLPKDVLTVLLRNQDDLDLPHEVVRREIAFFLQAGSHSSANAFTHVMDDLFTWFDDHPEDRQHVLDDRAFLLRCIHESLRLHPASPVAWRTALEDVDLRDGRHIPAGTKVVMDLMAANRDPDVFGADADQFNPHRVPADGVPLWGHTFGGGMHVCIGQELDGGVTAAGPDGHEVVDVFGMVALMAEAMLVHGAERDPDNPPRWDTTSERPHFGSYPVVFRGP
jgi:cytochrome P450